MQLHIYVACLGVQRVGRETKKDNDAVLCLERGIAGFPQYFCRCPHKNRPVRELGRTVENRRKSSSAVLFGSYILFDKY